MTIPHMIFDFTQPVPKPKSLDKCYQVINDLWEAMKQGRNECDKISQLL